MQQSTNFQLMATVESLSFNQNIIPNDTITISLKNLGNQYFWIRSVYINGENHFINTTNSLIFDMNGYFYYTRLMPPSSFGVLSLSTKSVDLNLD